MAEAQGESNHGVAGDEGFVPKTRAFWVLYQGCWLRPPAMESVKLVQEQFKARPDDVFLVTYPKCGTTWLKALAFTVTNRFHHPVAAGDDGHPLLAHHPQDLVPFLEMPYRQLQHPVAELEELASPRLLSTHLPVTLLPPCVSALGCRVVYMCRDPKDVLVSLWHFINKVDQNYTKDKAFELFARGESSYGPIWEHNLGFWKKSVSESDRVLFLKYDEMMAQPVEHVKMLAEFLRVPFSEEEVSRGVVEDVVHLCSFDKLRSLSVNSSGISDRVGGVPMENSSFFRTGKVGDWKNHLTQEMAEKLDAVLEEKLQVYSILETDIYRYHGHYMSDPGSTYRTRDEIAGITQECDPIEHVTKLILAHDLATEQKLKDMEKEIRKEIDTAIAKGKESPMPYESELLKNVHVNDCGLESLGVDRRVG